MPNGSGPEAFPGSVFGPPKPPDAGRPLPPGPETGGPPQEILRGREYYQMTPEEVDLLALWDSVEIYDPEKLKEGEDPLGEIKYALKVSLTFREGLKFGHNHYNLDYPEVQRRVQMQLRVPESMASRPQAYYVEQRVGYELGGRVRNLSLYKDRPKFWEKKVRNQYVSMTQGRATEEDITKFVEREKRNMEILSANEDKLERELIALETFSEARRIKDFAFRQRMQTHPSDGASADLLLNSPFSPDREHMEALFQTDEEFGRGVNDSLWFIVDTAFTPDGYAREGVSNLPPVPLKAEDGETRDQPIYQDFYAQNMHNTTEFRAWSRNLLGVADGDLDAAKTAWELALTWEVVNEFGKSVDRNKKIVLADPPGGSDLFFWTAHFRDKRKAELGENLDGERTQEELFISHSGLPLSVDEIGNLIRSYLHNSEVEVTEDDLKRFNYIKTKHSSDETGLGVKEELGVTDRLVKKIDWLISELEKRLENPPYRGVAYKRNVEDELVKYKSLKENIAKVLDPKSNVKKVKIPLFDLWYHGRFSMAYNKEHVIGGKKTILRFPWRLTDVPSPETESGEAPPATFMGWLIKRRKANFVKEDVRSRPSLSELSSPDFFVAERGANPARIRNWTQVLGRVERRRNPDGTWVQPPWKRPRTLQLMAWMEYHKSGTKPSKVEKDQPNRAYRTHTYREQAAEVGKGLEEGAGGGYGDIFHHALKCGWIFPEDKEYIKQKLEIRER